MLLSKIKFATAVALVVGALGIGVSGLTHETLAVDDAPAASKPTPAARDEGNIKETVLALEDRAECFSLGRDLDLDRIQEICGLARGHGFDFTHLVSFGLPI